MCGYCTEIYPIQIAMEQSLGQLWDFQSDEQRQKFGYYLQECHDLRLALLSNQEEAQAIVSIIDIISEEPKHIYLAPLEIIFCRVIETLVKYGFDSKEYQMLMANEVIHSIVAYEVKRPVIPGEELIFPKTQFETLINYDMFTVKEQWEEIVNSPSLVSTCEKLLNTYIDWWHCSQTDISLQKADALNGLSIFQKIYPLVFLSLMVITKSHPNHKSIHRLIETNPDAPLFEALELWLQRKASLSLYHIEGLNAFLPYAKKVRPALVYYLVVNNKLNETEKEVLREAIVKSGRYDETDTESRYKNGPFYMFIEPMIIEYLL